jgi:hypothetical protein
MGEFEVGLLKTNKRGAGRWRSRLCAGRVVEQADFDSCRIRRVMNDAGLFAAIAGLPSLSHNDRISGCEVCVESRICTGCRGIWYRSTLRLVVKLVAALAVRRRRQSIIEKNRANACPETHSSKCRKIGRISPSRNGSPSVPLR